MTSGVYTKDYWLAHGATYPEEFRHGPKYEAQEDAVLSALSTLAFQTVLEFGCGFGRITKRIYDAFPVRLYVATDVSPDALRNAERYVAERLPDTLLFVLADLDNAGGRHVTEPPLWQSSDNGPCDLVVAAEVLMHRTPEQVVGDVAALVAAADKYVLTVDWHEDSNRYAEGCYQHDYRALFAPFGDVVETVVPEARQAVYLVKVNRVEIQAEFQSRNVTTSVTPDGGTTWEGESDGQDR